MCGLAFTGHPGAQISSHRPDSFLNTSNNYTPGPLSKPLPASSRGTGHPQAQKLSTQAFSSQTPRSNAAHDARRKRDALSYTDHFDTPRSVTLGVIGVVRSPYKERFGTPRQPTVTKRTLGNAAQPARVVFADDNGFDLALQGLEHFEYCWIISFLHLNQGWNALVRPPRGPRVRQGVFATRSPHRPNSIGMSCVKISGVDAPHRTIHFHGCDLLDGTPVVDVKPYVPYCDSFPDAAAGWLDKLEESMTAPDQLSYSPPPDSLMHPLSPKQAQ